MKLAVARRDLVAERHRRALRQGPGRLRQQRCDVHGRAPFPFSQVAAILYRPGGSEATSEPVRADRRVIFRFEDGHAVDVDYLDYH